MATKPAGLRHSFYHYHGPTWVLTLAVYAAWTGLVVAHRDIPVYLLVPAAAYVTALHSSLQHESIHGLSNVPAWMRVFVAFPPLALLYPFPVYAKSHKIHHRDADLTDPAEDPESYYYLKDRWAGMGSLARAVALAHQTLLGRMILGPPIAAYRLYRQELPKLIRFEGKAWRVWATHAVLVAALFLFIDAAVGMAWWQYILIFAWPGIMLSLVRSFAEHRAADEKGERTAIVESGTFFGLLFLYNNLHVVHHRFPHMPWYEIPAYYRENREGLIRENGGFVFRGYGEIVRRFLITPVFHPAHPSF